MLWRRVQGKDLVNRMHFKHSEVPIKKTIMGIVCPACSKTHPLLLLHQQQISSISV
jgi:hypothetical protein